METANQNIGEMLYTNLLLTESEGRTGRILARGLENTDLAALGLYKNDRGPIFPSTARTS